MNCKIKMPSTKQKKWNRYSFIFSSLGVFAFLCLGIFLLLMPAPVFSTTASKTLIEKNAELREQEDVLILEKVNTFYNKGNYLKAVDEINIAIEYYQDSENIPTNIQLMAEASYYSWINSLYKNSKVLEIKDYNKVILYLTLHPQVVSSRISTLTEEIFQNEKNYFENKRIEEIKKENNRELNKILNQIVKLEQNKKNLDNVISGTTSIKDIRRAIEIEIEYAKAQRIKVLMIALYILIFISISILILVINLNHKKTIEAQKQFETTMKIVAILQQNSSPDESPYKPLKNQENSDSEKSTAAKSRKHFGLSDYESGKIALAYFEKPTAKKDFLAMQNQCIDLGEKIDKATGRKRNSKKVSELVFKLCKAAGVDDELSLIYYCAAMVYDAGFLSISKTILQGEHLTLKERYEVRSHVHKAKDYFGFISDDVKRIFLDAAEFHHENMDGKGYLSGLSGTKIPLIARFIRVAESYISLVNTRSYKQIMDSNSAFAELEKNERIYDSKILALLEKVI